MPAETLSRFPLAVIVAAQFLGTSLWFSVNGVGLSLGQELGLTETDLGRLTIATQAGFSRGPIYWHFKNKDELFEAVLLLSQGPLLALTKETRHAEGPPLEVLRAFADRWLRLLVEDTRHRQSFEIFLNKLEKKNRKNIIDDFTIFN